MQNVFHFHVQVYGRAVAHDESSHSRVTTCWVVLLPMPRAMRAFAVTPPALRRSPRSSSSRAPKSSISPTWRELSLSDPNIVLSQTLPTGQAFRWRSTGTHPHPASPTGKAEEWAGTLHDNLYLLRQSAPHQKVWYYAHPPSPNAHAILADYLRASEDFRESFTSCCSDAAFRRVYPSFSGVRTLRQPPVECLLSFICSSNNNIKRISGMVQHLESYGPVIATHSGISFHAFPDVASLAKITEDELRTAGFGYRAKFIEITVQQLLDLSKDYGKPAEDLLLSWRSLPRQEVIQRLMKFEGVGRKVASCVALMSLDQLGEVPVDTHVWKIAKRYMPQLREKTLTERVYDKIGDFFRDRFGDDFAGVAHGVLFVAEIEGRGVMEECVAGEGEEEDGAESDKTGVTMKKRKKGNAKNLKNGLRGVYKKGKRKPVVEKNPGDFQPTTAPHAVVSDRD